MRSRIPMIWLAVLTIYQSYVSTDALSTLKTVAANQEFTLKYMAKTAKLIKKIRQAETQTADATTQAALEPSPWPASF
jgi:hypothetical protein